MLAGLMYALLAGLFGALASSSAKLSLGASYLKELCDTAVRTWAEEEEEDSLTPGVHTTACDWVHIPLRLVCGLLLFSSNAVMWTFFAKALRHSSSSARATVTTTASNFISSAFLGHVIFGESHALLWWVGISLTLSGLFILHGSSLKKQQLDVKKDD
ncbi:hypothetical protein PGIGA_G00001020 [Pangasianodon gigas]|uniref:Uncharacterized protein n=1 Tax=Pangasianodon gigas TaxID=30993 RepID=A0ACC5W569_PANGG|nr:hypothetical protein [Pangasianodon gigas]